MIDLNKTYSMLKKYDSNERVSFDENSGKLSVYGDNVYAETQQHGKVCKIIVNFSGIDYISVVDDYPTITSTNEAIGVLMGILDGSLYPSIAEDDEKLLLLKRDKEAKIKHRITGGSVAVFIFGLVLILVSAAFTAAIIIAKKLSVGWSSGLIFLFSLAIFAFSVCGVLMMWKSYKLTEVTAKTYLFARAEKSVRK
ncbi:hypothetical protein [Ruminococcus flavefaciens]|uniref:hypothetical protein n=1 Tax=Ruminococcus flavefaciens TaxID=1265 RepID=UPI0026ED8083|nr:hypothetical protein [Ruminococcus flavefaciens]MDD7517683.1 hypothetical protein [Ruminococcus flavefaciens]MDY5693020.1 hypothetical protein [Ruminococcus flavefaciens]